MDCRFERLKTAAELATKDKAAQVNMLIYMMGDKADDILRSFKLSDADSKKYSEVKAKFEEHFIKKRNVMSELNLTVVSRRKESLWTRSSLTCMP